MCATPRASARGAPELGARKRGAENPLRLVASAKSWLSHAGADRRAPILPWGAPSEIPHISPVQTSAAYLRQLADIEIVSSAAMLDALPAGC